MLTQCECFNNEHEADEADEHDVELLESRENAPETFKAAKEAFDFVAAPLSQAIVLPRFQTIRFRRHDRRKTK